MWSRTTSLTALAVVVVLVAAACSKTPSINASDTASESVSVVEVSGDVEHVVEVELNEFSIEAADLDFVPGETVEFLIVNAGVAPHEFRLSNQERVDEHIAAGHDDHEDVGGDTEEGEDAVLFLEAGQSGALVFTFPENGHDYTAAVCLLPGHYEAGMATDLSYQT
jgi:uncharacterized cupredoxin-like copper-binding protein